MSTEKKAAIYATLVFLAIAGYCALLALSPKETAIKILDGSAIVGCALVAWMVLYLAFVIGIEKK